MTIAFLHTAEVHVGTFTALVTELAPGTPTAHVVDPDLLATARAAGGVDADLGGRLAERLAHRDVRRVLDARLPEELDRFVPVLALGRREAVVVRKEGRQVRAERHTRCTCQRREGEDVIRLFLVGQR